MILVREIGRYVGVERFWRSVDVAVGLLLGIGLFGDLGVGQLFSG